MIETANKQARYVMIGGFLGAGKSTAVLRLAEHLTARGLRVGLITNDQSVGLVDTALLASHGFDVEEIAGAPSLQISRGSSERRAWTGAAARWLLGSVRTFDHKNTKNRLQLASNSFATRVQRTCN